MNNKSINTILFDLDGTLLDTNELILQSFEHTFRRHVPEQTYSREDLLQFMGPPLQDSFQRVRPDELDEMVTTYRSFNLENHDALVQAFDGVYETIRILHEQGYKLAIVSTKIKATVEKGLRLTGLDEFFPVIIGLDQVEHAKPHPEPVQKALELLGSNPEEAVMVGDNSHDILSGQRASTLTAGVSWSLKGEAFLRDLKPDVILHTMGDLLTFLEEKNR